MHYGSGQVIRQVISVAKPWQRYLIGILMIAGGAALLTIGHVAGGLLAAGGLFFLWRMARHKLDRKATTPQRPGNNQ